MENTPRPLDHAIAAGEYHASAFAGYGEPNYTQIPDLFLDEQMHTLSGAEVKVMLYIFRRTYGFKKRADAISYSQLLNGITSHDGRRYDYGAGVSNGSLAKALATLEERGYIFRHRQYADDGGNRATVYELNKDGQPHFDGRESGKSGSPIFPTPSPKNGVAPPSKKWSSPPPEIGDTPSLNIGETRNRKRQKTEEQHTDTHVTCEEGATLLCVSNEKTTYPIENSSSRQTQKRLPSASPREIHQPFRRRQNSTLRPKEDLNTSDRTEQPLSATMPLNDGQRHIAARLEQVHIAATKAATLAAHIVASGRDLAYIEQWVGAIDQARITNPAAYLVTVLGELADPPRHARHTDTGKQYTEPNGRYARFFNRSPPVERTVP